MLQRWLSIPWLDCGPETLIRKRVSGRRIPQQPPRRPLRIPEAQWTQHRQEQHGPSVVAAIVLWLPATTCHRKFGASHHLRGHQVPRQIVQQACQLAQIVQNPLVQVEMRRGHVSQPLASSTPEAAYPTLHVIAHVILVQMSHRWWRWRCLW